MNNLEKYLKMDAERESRDKRVANGLRVKWYRITYLHGESGFGIEYYELPFDKDIMKKEINEHIIYCINKITITNLLSNDEISILEKYKTPENYLQCLIKQKQIKPVSISSIIKNHIIKEKIPYNTEL
ncbi:unnamed protein product, partial [marine sediment metagenome]